MIKMCVGFTLLHRLCIGELLWWMVGCRPASYLSLQTEVSAAKVRNLQPTWGSVVSYCGSLLSASDRVSHNKVIVVHMASG